MPVINGKTDKILFYVIIEGFLIYGIAMELIPNPGWLFTYPYLALMSMTGVKICIQGNNWKEWILTILLGFVAILSFKGSGDRAVLLITLGICCAKNVNLDKLLKIDLSIRIFATFLFVVLPFIGIIPNHIGVIIGGRPRTFFGWSHPNGMGQRMLLIVLEWIYIRHGRFKWYDYVGIVGIVVLLDLTANSRTAEILMLVILLLEASSMLLVQYGKKVYIIWTWFTLGIFWVSVLLPILVVGLYDGLREFFSEALGTVGSRFVLTASYVENHGITLFGSPYDSSKEEYLDMLFANVLFMRGVVFGVVIVLLSVLSIYFAYKKKNEKFLLLLFTFFAFGIMESEHINMIYSFFPVLLGIPVFNWFDNGSLRENTKCMVKFKNGEK